MLALFAFGLDVALHEGAMELPDQLACLDRDDLLALDAGVSGVGDKVEQVDALGKLGERDGGERLAALVDLPVVYAEASRSCMR